MAPTAGETPHPSPTDTTPSHTKPWFAGAFLYPKINPHFPLALYSSRIYPCHVEALRGPTSPEGWDSLKTPQSDISRGPTTKGETRFRQVECVHECRRGLIGWPPHQADQNKNAKTNVLTFVRSLFEVPQPLQAAA